MVNSDMVRRLLIITLVFTLLGLGRVPLSACALLTSQLGECSTPKTEARCSRMNMDEARTRPVAASDSACCVVSKAPVSRLQRSRPYPIPAGPVAVTGLTRDVSLAQGSPQVIVAQAPSPPSLQSLFCTFLI